MNIFSIAWILSSLLYASATFAASYDLSSLDQDVVGENQEIITKRGDTWKKLAIKHGLSTTDLKQANPTVKQRYRLKTNTPITLPTEYVLPQKSLRQGIVINMAEQRLYFFPTDEDKVYTYPVAMGRAKWRTPTAATHVTSKTMYPTWYVPESIREHSIDTHGYLLPEFVPPGPSNPLGTRAIYLKLKGILIHGTNNRSSIGRLVSSGCIRMHNLHVEELFDRVGPNMAVSIVHHPVKVGYKSGQILIEVHPEIKAVEEEATPLNSVDTVAILEKISSERNMTLDWTRIESIIETANGMPTIISKTGFNPVNQPLIYKDLINKEAYSTITSMPLK